MVEASDIGDRAIVERTTDRVFTIPNILSFVRLGSVPVFVWLFVTGRENAAVILYMTAAWTDFFDGYIARRFGQVSELGKLMDPLADRVMIVALAIALVARHTLPWWLATAIIARDVLILSAFPILERRGVERVRVNFIGKCATAALLAGLTWLAISETGFVWADQSGTLGMIFTVIGVVLYWVAAYMYLQVARTSLKRLGEPPV
jgi:cardiolipin synthase (CMP-forming)